MNITVKKQRELSQRIFEYANIWLKEGISFLASSSLFIATVSFCVAYFSFLLFNMSPNYTLLFAASLVTFSVYNINKVTDKEEDSVNLLERYAFVKHKERILISFSVIAYIIALLIVTLENTLLIPIFLVPLFCGIIYSTRTFSNLPRLKDIFAVSNVIVTLSWVMVATLLPAIYLYRHTIFLLVFYFLFIKIFVNAILFDVRDMKGDGKQGVNSIPVIIGIDKTRKLLLALNSLLIPWLAVSIYLGLFTKYLPILI
ncbi:MAG: UbiA family prenyltransferase, partial [Thermoplasmatales archaeon]|nr:UbiA family prenyltransferase [Thermoplasmatales archaeon]